MQTFTNVYMITLEKIERAIRNAQSRDTDNIGHKTQDDEKHNTESKTDKQHERRFGYPV